MKKLSLCFLFLLINLPGYAVDVKLIFKDGGSYVINNFEVSYTSGYGMGYRESIHYKQGGEFVSVSINSIERIKIIRPLGNVIHDVPLMASIYKVDGSTVENVPVYLTFIRGKRGGLDFRLSLQNTWEYMGGRQVEVPNKTALSLKELEVLR